LLSHCIIRLHKILYLTSLVMLILFSKNYPY
jgi:hypothetical protein